MLMLKNLGCTRLPVSAAYMPIENEHILVQCKYIKKTYILGSFYGNVHFSVPSLYRNITLGYNFLYFKMKQCVI